jgi:hypothetical protein
MSKTKTTLDKAYGNVPKEVQDIYIWDWIPTRGVKYYYLTLWRKLFR